MFERILVPVDGSDQALAALELAAKIGNSFDSELFILCIYRHRGPLEASMYMIGTDDPKNTDVALREHATNVVETAKKRAAENGAKKVRGFAMSGPPARTIIKFAEEKDAKLIVLGSRGLGDIEGYLLGSVSHKVTSLADCPVLVV